VTVIQLERDERVGEPGAIERRAMALWPRLDAAALRRCGHDPKRIAALVSRRTAMPPESILRVLVMPVLAEDEIGTWFG
jgi:hypothetical protein